MVSILAFVFVNYSINTIDKEYKSNHQTSSALEIETLTELILEEILQLPDIIADSEDHENEKSTGHGLTFFINSTNPVIPNTALKSIKHQNLFIENHFNSYHPGTVSPPPEVS
jgi:hypothetical protein